MNDLNLDAAHPLQPYWDLALAAVRGEALRMALEWQLFSRLQQPASAADVARQLQLDAEHTGLWLETLWSMELLKRDAQTPALYRNTPLAERYLRAEAADYCGDAWVFRLQGLGQFAGQLAQRVREGRQAPAPGNSAATIEHWTAAARVQIAQEQRAVTVDLARRLMSRIPEFASARRLLDVGGGPGLVAIALAGDNPLLYGEVFDFAPTVAVAAENIRAADLEQRLGVRAGDLATDPLGEGYDLIWCSSVLHFMPDLDATLRKVHGALRPGGVLVSAHAEIPLQACAAQRVMPYYLAMQMQGRRVTRAGELREALARNGFGTFDEYPDLSFAVAPVTVLVARREAP